MAPTDVDGVAARLRAGLPTDVPPGHLLRTWNAPSRVTATGEGSPMPVWRIQTEISVDTVLPRDVLMINPHFDDHGVTTDPAGLCNDLAEAISQWTVPGGAYQVKCTAYDANGTPPVFPAGESTFWPGVSGGAQEPRELALCLSYYSGQNRPRYRGRLYVPVCLLGVSTGGRPNTAALTKVMTLGPILTGLGGPDVDWVVYSQVDSSARPVSDYYCDDEWDVVRSRGLRPTTRQTATASE